MHEETILAEAIAISDPVAREEYLKRACSGDEALLHEIRSLLSAHGNQNILDEPARGSNLLMTGAWPALEKRGARPGPDLGLLVADRYQLSEIIGEGGMGTVWRAEQIRPIKRPVALKVIKPGLDSARVLSRFEAERQALALMDHPSIAKVLDAGVLPDGRPFFAMELVDGQPLTKYCDERQLTIRERINLLVQIGRAVQHAHQKGVIHRDLKPGNILITEVDSRPVPKVIDFGLAKALSPALLPAESLPGMRSMAGTPLYMAPEQTGTTSDIDTRADVYSLGVILYELLTGTTPIAADSLRQAMYEEMLRLIREQEPPTPSSRLTGDQTLASRAAVRGIEPGELKKAVRGDLEWVTMK